MNIETKHAVPTALLRVAATHLQRKLKAPLVAVGNGSESVASASKKALSALQDAHAVARYAGRLSAGDRAPVGDADREAVALLAEEQQQYFEKFAAQVEAGKYTNDAGEVNEAAIEDRAGLYTLRLRGTANEGWAGALDEGEMIVWELGGSENNCSICPDLADQGPYKPAEMPTFPGACETPCLFRCGCSIRTVEGGAHPPKSFLCALKFSPDFLRAHAHVAAK